MQKFLVTMRTSELPPTIHWGSVLHGMLLEHLPEPWPEQLHTNTLHPFSQWVEVREGFRFVWHIQVLDNALGMVLENLLNSREEWPCRHLRCTLIRECVTTENIDFENYVGSFFQQKYALPGIQINFHTPTTHKVQGRYALFPTVEWIGHGLNVHLCTMAPDFALADEEILQQVLCHTRISRYELRSSVYCLEGSRVTGYTGRMELHFDGPDPLRRLCGLLFSLIEWCGTGVKTSLGMGGCTVSPLPERNRK